MNSVVGALPAWVGQAVRFGIVGLLAAGVDFGVLHAGMALGAGPGLARVPAVAVALVFTWLLNRRLTFRTPVPPSWVEFVRYAFSGLLGMAINLAIYWIALALGAPVWFAFTVGVGIAAVVTFLRYRAVLHHD